MIEQLYPVKLVEEKAIFALLLGIAYSVIGIGIAVLLFPEDPALVAVALISLMFYPTLKSLIKSDESNEAREQKITIFSFINDHKHIFKVYLLLFLGVMLGFSFFSLNLPALATNNIFDTQVNILYGHSGKAFFDQSLFHVLFSNNVAVMLLIVVTAYFLGDGGIFLLTWNASVWGTIFGLFAKNYATDAAKDPFLAFGLVLVIVITHTLLEAFAYICAATAGSVFSRATLTEKFLSPRFNHVLKGTIITLLVGIIILVLAVAVETYVLGNVTVYQAIVKHTFL